MKKLLYKLACLLGFHTDMIRIKRKLSKGFYYERICVRCDRILK